MLEPTLNWSVYMLHCADGTLYTGIAKDLTARVATHNAGKGAKYTRRRLPVRLVWSEPTENRSTASKREYAVKQLNRRQKLALVSTT